MKILLLLVLGFIAGFFLIMGITKIINYFRGKRPVNYGYILVKIKVFLDFPTFKSFYLAAPESFELDDETAYFYEDYHRRLDNLTRIGFKTLADLWAYQDWKKKIDSKKKNTENDEATLKFCRSMARVLEQKKQAELKKAQSAAQDSINIIDGLMSPAIDSALRK